MTAFRRLLLLISSALTACASVGKWRGYVRNFKFASGSDALLLAITPGANGTLGGTLVFGDSHRQTR